MIISIASQKGGTGKTTTSISISSGLARKGKKVLLVDVDSQANSSKVLLSEYSKLRPNETVCSTILERFPLPIHKTSVENLDVVPSHILLSNTDIDLTTAIDHREARLKQAIDKVKDSYDYIIIDCPPTLSWLTINALTASDEAIVTISPGYFELDSIVQIVKTIDNVRDLFNNNLKIKGFLFTMNDSTINAKTSMNLLRQTYTDFVFQTFIPRNTDIRDAHMNHQDIFEYSPNSPSALSYTRLIKEIFKI